MREFDLTQYRAGLKQARAEYAAKLQARDAALREHEATVLECRKLWRVIENLGVLCEEDVGDPPEWLYEKPRRGRKPKATTARIAEP